MITLLRPHVKTMLPVAGVMLALLLMAWLLQTTPLQAGAVRGNTLKQSYQLNFLICYLPMGVAVGLLLLFPRRLAWVLVPLGMIGLGLLMLTLLPMTSTDAARYNWDGIVQKSGISPYKYAPADPALKNLRPDWLFFNATYAPEGVIGCGGARAYLVPTSNSETAFCTGINRPTVTTIYPPVAELLFLLMRLPVNNGVGYLPAQILGLVSLAAVTGLLLWALAGQRRHPGLAALVAWNPFVLLAGVNDAHIDMAATALGVGATLLVLHRRGKLGGLLLGAAILTKFTPLLLAPPLLRRSPWRVGLAAAATVIGLYLPYVLWTGGDVFGYLAGYLNEEGYDNGSRSALLSFLPGSSSTFVAGAVLLLVALYGMWRLKDEPWVAQTMLVGSALLLLSPKYGWYALLLMPLIVLSGRYEWLPLPVLLLLHQLLMPEPMFQKALLGCLLVVVAAAGIRHFLSGKKFSINGLPV